MEVQCKQGRLLLAGSANATNAGLFGLNIEASVLRVQRDAKSYAQSSVGTPPARQAPDDNKEAQTGSDIGVLHAKLEGDTVVGRILKPLGHGKMLASLRSPLRSAEVGEIETDEQGLFNLPAAGFELDALKTGRLILRLEKPLSRKGRDTKSRRRPVKADAGADPPALSLTEGGTQRYNDVPRPRSASIIYTSSHRHGFFVALLASPVKLHSIWGMTQQRGHSWQG